MEAGFARQKLTNLGIDSCSPNTQMPNPKHGKCDTRRGAQRLGGTNGFGLEGNEKDPKGNDPRTFRFFWWMKRKGEEGSGGLAGNWSLTQKSGVTRWPFAGKPVREPVLLQKKGLGVLERSKDNGPSRQHKGGENLPREGPVGWNRVNKSMSTEERNRMGGEPTASTNRCTNTRASDRMEPGASRKREGTHDPIVRRGRGQLCGCVS